MHGKTTIKKNTIYRFVHIKSEITETYEYDCI
jgi:hypothetical protein